MYSAYKGANPQIEELVLRIEGMCLKAELQMTTLKDIKDSLDAKLVAFFDDCMARLAIKLLSARAEIESIIGSDSGDLTLGDLTINLKRPKKLYYSLFEKHLVRTVQVLESWHTVFDPSWLLLTRPPTNNI